MASIRILSATELGAIRFASAAASNRWPVEIRFREGSGSFTSSPREALSAHLVSEGCSPSTAPLVRAARGEWRTVLDSPPGPLQYSVLRGGVPVESPGAFVVEPPDPPFENTRLAAGLKGRAPSGATQVQRPADGHCRWKVRFVYSEPLFGVRDVYVVPVAEGAEDDDPASVKCERLQDDSGKDCFAAVLSLPAGVCRYRFRVVYSEVIAPASAPFTRLGFDAGPSGSGTRGLFTWELSATVNDLTSGDRAAESFMAHTKGASAVNDSQSIVASENSDKPVDLSSTGVNVRDAAAALEEKKTRDQAESPTAVGQHDRDGPMKPAKPAKALVAIGEASPDACSSGSAEKSRGNVRAGFLPRALLVAAFSAALATCLSVMRGASGEEHEDIGSDCGIPPRAGAKRDYLKHATSQSM